MGDRWNIHNDAAEAARYRREVPLRTRVLRAAIGWLLLVVFIAINVAGAVYAWHHRG